MKLSITRRKETKAGRTAKSRDRDRSTASEAESSEEAAPRRRRRDEPENHTQLVSGKKGHVTY